jgi:hypothetical protein
MSKKLIYIIAGIVLVVLLAWGGLRFAMQNTKKHSPLEEVTHTVQDVEISVKYCRPFKKGRLIFGAEEDGALQPYGQYWRVGANEATEITLSKNVIFGGEALEAGQYVLYAYPGESNWKIGLNSELGRWGYNEVDHEKDVLQVNVPAGVSSQEIEQFTINFSGADTLAFLNLLWDKTKVSIPIEPAE